MPWHAPHPEPTESTTSLWGDTTIGTAAATRHIDALASRDLGFCCIQSDCSCYELVGHNFRFGTAKSSIIAPGGI